MVTPLSELTEQERTQAVERFHVLRPFLEEDIPLLQIASQQQVSLRTLRRWIERYHIEGLPGLIRKRRADRGERRRLPSYLQQFVEGLALQTPPLSVAIIHRKVCELAQQHDLKPPSYGLVYDIVRQLPTALTTLAHEGAKAYKQRFDLLHRREAQAPNEIWQADHCLLDILLVRDGQAPAKPWLTVVMDDYSRAVAGYFLTFDAPSALNTSLALRQAIWRKDEPRWHVCGIPQILYMEYVPRNIFDIMWPFVLCGLTARWSVISWWCSSVWPHNAYRDWSHWRSDGSSRQMGFPRHASAVSVDTSHAWSASAFIRSVISA